MSGGARRLGMLASALMIVLASILVFSNTLHNTFALDDFYRVSGNPGIQEFWPPWRHFADPRTMSTLDRIAQFRPLLPLTLSINYALSGDSLVGYHLGNLLLQIIASLLVFALALELLQHWTHPEVRYSQLIATASALAFAIHPVSGIAVNYISARDLLLMQCFLIAMLLAYARMRRLGENAWRWAAVLALLAASLLSKTNLVIVPLVFFIFDVVLARDSVRDRRVWLRAGASAAVVIVFFGWTRLALGFSDVGQVVSEGTAGSYALTQLRLHAFHYLPHFWWPFSIRQLPLVEPAQSLFELRVLIGLALVIGTLVLAWRYRRTQPLISFCVLMYWTLMIPESSVLPFHQWAADYRPYPASAFLFLVACYLLFRHALLPAAITATALMILYLGAVSHAMNRKWESGERLWTHSVQHGGDAVAHLNLAMAIPDRRDSRVRHHLEEAVRMNPNYVLGHINLCLLQIDSDEAEAGLQRCRHAIELEPTWAQSYYWLATALRKLGRKQEAMAASSQASDLDPANIEYAYQAALDAQASRDFTRSLELAERVRRRNAEYKELGFLRGFALQMNKENDTAIRVYQEFLRDHPDHAQVHFNLAFAYMTLERCEDAIPHFERTLHLNPRYTEAALHLARCRAQTSP